MAKRRAHRKVHRGRRTKRGFKTWSLGKKIGVIALSIFLAIVIGGGAAAAAFLSSKMEKLDVQQLDAEALEISSEIERKSETGYLNVALFGVDSRDASLGVGTRSDSMMVASLNRATGEVKICSVYRDTLLQQSDGSYNKANAAYSFGGVEGAVALLNKNLDLDIEHYVTVNFNALIDVIDALGGITIELTQEEAEYVNGYADETARVTGHEWIELPGAGWQLLNGVQATSYCRIRYTKGDDFKRTERQRLVIEKIVEKLQNANLATINKIIDSVFDEVGTNFTLTEIMSYAKDFNQYYLGETSGFPFDKTTATLNGIGSTVIPVDLANNVVQLHQFLFGEDGYTPSSTVASIADGVRAKAGNVKTATEEELANYKSDESAADRAVSERISNTSETTQTTHSNNGNGGGRENNGNEGGGGNTGGGNQDSGNNGGNSGGGNGGGDNNSGGNEGGGGNTGGGESSGNEGGGGEAPSED